MRSSILFAACLIVLGVIYFVAPRSASQTRDERQSFTEEDVRDKGASAYIVSATIDREQPQDLTIPVVISRINSFLGKGKYAGLLKVTSATFDNRTANRVNKVQLRWIIVDVREAEKVLLGGVTIPFDLRIPAKSKMTISTPVINFTKLAQPLLRQHGELNGHYQLVISVQQVNFDDGSFWRFNKQFSSNSRTSHTPRPDIMRVLFREAEDTLKTLPPIDGNYLKNIKQCPPKNSMTPVAFAQTADPPCSDNAICQGIYNGGLDYVCDLNSPASPGGYCDLGPCNEFGCNCGSGSGTCFKYADDDGDGYTQEEGDCDDSPGSGEDIYPGAREICDGDDNDCDRETDEGCPTPTPTPTPSPTPTPAPPGQCNGRPDYGQYPTNGCAPGFVNE